MRTRHSTRDARGRDSFAHAALRRAALHLVLLGGVALAALACGPDVEEEDASGCAVGDEIHEPGERFASSDGCNSCECRQDGSVICTTLACFDCTWQGKSYYAGDRFPMGDDCNTCECLQDGTVTCTTLACMSCHYQGQAYQRGDTFPAGDGCNSCECLEGGTVSCTQEVCAS